MRNKVLLALALVALMVAPAFAAVQNVKVSGDIDSTYIHRDSFNFGLTTGSSGGFTPGSGLVKQNTFITQTRVRIDADLSDNVSTTVALINERAWDMERSTDTNVQLYLAYATMREFLYSPLTVSVGRQVFHYGNGLIMGDGGVNNAATGNLATVAADLTKRTSYDGVKAILDYKPLTLDMIYFKNGSGPSSGSATNGGAVLSNGTYARLDDSDVFGLNANYQLGDAMNTIAEGYFFARVNGKYNGGTMTNTKGDKLFVPGLRVSTNPIKGLNAQAEVAWQLGNKQNVDSTTPPAIGDNQHREAMAYQFMASYTLPAYEKYKPMVNASYTHVSGDKTGNVNTPASSTQPKSRETYSAWDPFNENQGSGTIYNSLFNLTNMNIVSAGATITPMEDVTTNFTWSGLWADRRYTNGTTAASNNVLMLIQPDGSGSSGLITPTVTGRKDLGNEYDVNVNYAYTEDVTFGVSLGWFVPGKTFGGANDDVAKQALAHVLVNF